MLLSHVPQKAGDALLGVFDAPIQNNFRRATDKHTYNVQALQLRPDNDKFFANFFMFFATEAQASAPAPTTEIAENTATPTTSPPPTAPSTTSSTTPPATSPTTPNTSNNSSANKPNELLRVEVINHYKPKEKEFFIQYTNNSIALRSKNEKLLWQRKFPAPITGAVIQIDYLNNKKLQCLFCAAGKLYLYDRNGSIVKPFPVTLQSAVTLAPGSTVTVQKQPKALKISKDGKTTIIYMKSGKVENK
jgi:hypothetical protein